MRYIYGNKKDYLNKSLAYLSYFSYHKVMKFLDIKEAKDKTYARFELVQLKNSLSVKSLLSIDLDYLGIEHTLSLDEIISRAKSEAVKLYNSLNQV
jgi:hypothetical protein